MPGCATGEEVYSLAMLLREHVDTLRAPPRVDFSEAMHSYKAGDYDSVSKRWTSAPVIR